MKKLVTGILAHVDAGKTTLSEAMLYVGGEIRRLGRVDKGDAFLDTYELEKKRGITIFSKQALVRWRDMELTLLDTPGHVDFSAEMERTLQVMDYGILVVSGTDGIQEHTRTLWRLLGLYGVPVLVFFNKMDLAGLSKGDLLKGLRDAWKETFVDFGEAGTEAFYEQIAMTGEEALNGYLETGVVREAQIQAFIRQRKLFPCFFGSALKLEGVEEFMAGLLAYGTPPSYSDAFGAKVFKISRDGQGNKLVHLKITGGTLKTKDLLDGEKVNEIRIYSGDKFETVKEAKVGTICAVTGLLEAHLGKGLGAERSNDMTFMEPVMEYRLLLPEGMDEACVLPRLLQLQEEDPKLHVAWDGAGKEIHVKLMGQVQMEVLKSLIAKRFGIEAEFGNRSIRYLETIENTVEGVGHFEPLRHYAEVHLLMEPGVRGSGLQFESTCSETVLLRNWQRLVLTHLAEKEHKGVLTGSAITDMKITLVSGRAHVKHTEGGDFRQAVYRAVRQGLMQARCALLEPYYDFRLEIGERFVGRAMSDVERFFGTARPPSFHEGLAVLTGNAPAAHMIEYQQEVTAYSGGTGRLSLDFSGYGPCHDAKEVMEAKGYEPELDEENPAGSIFCAHGSGFLVPWDRVFSYMHLEGCGKAALDEGVLEAWQRNEDLGKNRQPMGGGVKEEPWLGTEEVEAILERTHYANSRKTGKEGGAGWKNRGREAGALKIRRFSEEAPAEGRAEPGREEPGKEEREERRESREWQERRESQESREWRERRESRESRESREWRERREGREGKERREDQKRQGKQEKQEYLLVDGYNIIFAWEELRELAEKNIDGARGRLLDILCNYQGIRQCRVLVVFDAYRVQGHGTECLDYHNIQVVFTKEAETADGFIEKFAHENGRKWDVLVATSDRLEQIIIQGQGCRLISAKGLKEEIGVLCGKLNEELEGRRGGAGRKSYLLDSVSEETRLRLKELSDE